MQSLVALAGLFLSVVSKLVLPCHCLSFSLSDISILSLISFSLSFFLFEMTMLSLDSHSLNLLATPTTCLHANRILLATCIYTCKQNTSY